MFATEDEAKRAFAEAWLRNPTKPYDAAVSILGFTQWAHIAATQWIIDPIVQGEKERLLDEFGAKHFLPTKEEMAQVLLAEAAGARNAEDKARFFKLAADIMGYIERPAVNVNSNNTNVTTVKVLKVKDHGDIEEWSRGAVAQQTKLINGATSNNTQN